MFGGATNKMYVLPLYHVDTLERINDYINDEIFLDSKEDGDWLGSGMYFWDNIANSKYWFAKRVRDDSTLDYGTVKVQQKFKEDELLDLTDVEIMGKVLQCINLIEAMPEFKNINVREHIGTLLNVLYNITKKNSLIFGFKFSVIKGIGLYRRTRLAHNDDRLIDVNFSRRPHLTHYMKTIYLFKHDECVIDHTKLLTELDI